jgi:hypothetical protein
MEHRYPWQEVFEQFTAADPKTLAERMHEVEALLSSRLQALVHSTDGHLEKQALRESIQKLERIQIEKLGYPDWRNSA